MEIDLRNFISGNLSLYIIKQQHSSREKNVSFSVDLTMITKEAFTVRHAKFGTKTFLPKQKKNPWPLVRKRTIPTAACQRS
jgi:hypothetical protein